jgi:hypothetical protein
METFRKIFDLRDKPPASLERGAAAGQDGKADRES